jgi:hypothetical protein
MEGRGRAAEEYINGAMAETGDIRTVATQLSLLVLI